MKYNIVLVFKLGSEGAIIVLSLVKWFSFYLSIGELLL